MSSSRDIISGMHGTGGSKRNDRGPATKILPGAALRGLASNSHSQNPYIPGVDTLSRPSGGIPPSNFYHQNNNNNNPRAGTAAGFKSQNSSSRFEGNRGNDFASGSNSQRNNSGSSNPYASSNRIQKDQNGRELVLSQGQFPTPGAQNRDAGNKASKPNKFRGGSRPNESRAPPAPINAESRLSAKSLQQHLPKDRSLDRSQGTSADNAVAIEDDSDEETQPSAPLRRRNDSNVERGMGSRTSNGNTRDPRGQEKGKGRSYYGDLDQDFDGAVGDESRDEIDLLYDERNPRHSTPLPSIPKKSSGMKAKNGLKVGDEIVDVDIEEVKKTNQKKKKKTQEVVDRVDHSFFKESAPATSSNGSSVKYSDAELKGKESITLDVPLVTFFIGEEYQANPEYRFQLICTKAGMSFRKNYSGDIDPLFVMRYDEVEFAELGYLKNGQGFLRLSICPTNKKLGASISKRFKSWSVDTSTDDDDSNRSVWFVINISQKLEISDDTSLCRNHWKLLHSRIQSATAKRGKESRWVNSLPMDLLNNVERKLWPFPDGSASKSSSNPTRTTRKSATVGGQTRLNFENSDGSAKKPNATRTVSTPQPVETKPRPRPRAAVSGRKSESATTSTSNSKNQKGTPSYVNTVDDPCVIDSSDEEEADKSKQASTSKTPSSSRQGAAANTRMARRANAGPAPEEIKIARFPTKGLGGVTVSQADLDKLKEGEFLNDTIVEFGLKYLHEGIKARDPVLYEQIYIFSSFFHKRLSEGRREKKGYEFVKKWTNRVNIFDKKYLVIPINEHLHWYLAIIVNPSYIKNPSKILLQQKQAQEQEKALRAAKAAEAAEKRASRSKAGRQSEGSAASTSKIFELPHEETKDGDSVPQPVLNEVGNGKGKGKSRGSENGKDVEMKDAQNESQVVDVSDEEDQDNDDPQAGAGTDDPSQLPRRGRAGQVVAPQSPEFEAGKQEQGGIRERSSEIKDKDGDHRMRTSDSQRVLSEEEDELEGDEGNGSQLPSNSHPQFVNDAGGPGENEDDMDMDGEDTISLKSGNADDDDQDWEITDSFSKPSKTPNRDLIDTLFGRSPSGSKPSSTQQKENGNSQPSTSFNPRHLDSDLPQPQTTSGINGIKVPVHDVRSARAAYSSSSSRSSKQARRILDSQHQEDEDMENPPPNYASDHSYKHFMNGSNPGNGPLTGGGPLPDVERETSAASDVVTPPPRDSQLSVNQTQAEPEPLIKRSQSLSTDKEPSQEPPLPTQTEAQPLPQAESESEPAPQQQQPQASTSETPMDLDDSRADSPPVRSIPDKKKNKSRDSNASAPPKKQTAAQLADASGEPILVVLDSLGGTHKALKKALENWLQEEAKDKAKIPEDQLGILHLNDAKAPLQPNFCDCGIYLIHYFDRLFKDPETLFPLCYAQDGSQEKREHPSWEAPTIETKRQYWKDTILATGDEWKENLRIAQEKEDEEKRARRDAAETSKNAASTSSVTPLIDAPEQNDEIDGDQMDVDPDSDLNEAAEVEDEIIEVEDPSSKSKGKGKEKEQSRARSRGSEDEREASEKGNKRMRRDAASPEAEIPRAH